VTTQAAPLNEVCRAVTLVRAGLLAAVSGDAIYWLRVGANGFGDLATVAHNLPPVVACYPHYRGNELILVCADGTVARVPQVRY
jgi:hypothetical protein